VRGHDYHSLREEDGLIDIVGDEQHRHAGLLPESQQIVLQRRRVIASTAANGSSISST
jgi:hypothetical protein